MRRRPFLFAILLALFLLAGVGTVLGLLLRHEPNFYRTAAVAPGPRRLQQSGQFLGDLVSLTHDIKDRQDWAAEFTAEGINSYLADGFVQPNAQGQPLPDGVREPRIALDDGRLRVGFRYGSGRWSTVVSLDFRVWLAREEPNAVALELLGAYAGALPVSSQTLLERVSDAIRQLSDTARRANNTSIEVSWYRHDGHPVALLRFQGDQPRTTVQLKQLVLEPGRLRLHGSSVDSPARAMREPTPNGG